MKRRSPLDQVLLKGDLFVYQRFVICLVQKLLSRSKLSPGLHEFTFFWLNGVYCFAHDTVGRIQILQEFIHFEQCTWKLCNLKASSEAYYQLLYCIFLVKKFLVTLDSFHKIKFNLVLILQLLNLLKLSWQTFEDVLAVDVKRGCLISSFVDRRGASSLFTVHFQNRGF